jgi:hypothetical protein
VGKRTSAIILWLFAPTWQMRRKLQSLQLGRARFFLLWTAPRTLVRLAVAGVFVWAIASAHWGGAGVAGGLLVLLGLLSWVSWVAARRFAKRLGRVK